LKTWLGHAFKSPKKAVLDVSSSQARSRQNNLTNPIIRYKLWRIRMKTYSTKQVAHAIGVNRVTLQRWLLAGKVPEPHSLKTGGVDVRLWSDQDLQRVRQFKQANYGKGRGRKKASKK
jgi:hypothetical protein